MITDEQTIFSVRLRLEDLDKEYETSPLHAELRNVIRPKLRIRQNDGVFLIEMRGVRKEAMN